MFETELGIVMQKLGDDKRCGMPLLVALGGSHAYGLAGPGSDVDLRGFALPVARDVLLGRNFGQVEMRDGVDACIYSLSKACDLLAACNPNMVEMLGLDADSVLVDSPAYRLLRDHADWFLSRKAAHTFGGYATAQLRRLQNAMARDADATRLAEGAMRSMQAALDALPERYPSLSGRASFALDIAGDDEEPVVEVSMHADGVRAAELASFARELDSARKSAETIGKNRRRESSKLAKHASHLIRLLHMGAELLEGKGVRTRRTDDAGLLLALKRGMWLSEDASGVRSYDDAFWDLLAESQERFERAERETSLPASPDREAIDGFVADVHADVIMRGGASWASAAR